MNLATRIAKAEAATLKHQARTARPMDQTARSARVAHACACVDSGSTDRRHLRVAQLMHTARQRAQFSDLA